jgi:hypothetical protein
MNTLAYNALRHSAVALVATTIAAALLPTTLYSAIAVTFFFLGRERRDHEIKSKLNPEYWWKGWNIGKWSIDGQVDLIPPILIVWVIYVAEILI